MIDFHCFHFSMYFRLVFCFRQRVRAGHFLRLIKGQRRLKLSLGLSGHSLSASPEFELAEGRYR